MIDLDVDLIWKRTFKNIFKKLLVEAEGARWGLGPELGRPPLWLMRKAFR